MIPKTKRAWMRSGVVSMINSVQPMRLAALCKEPIHIKIKICLYLASQVILFGTTTFILGC